MAEQAPQDRTALTALDHPMNYASSISFSEVKPKSNDERLTYIYERRRIDDLLSQYYYAADLLFVEPHDFKPYNGLFTEDCQVTFYHGPHKADKRSGNAGLGEWLLQNVSMLKRMTHLGAGAAVKFESDTVAHGRSCLMSVGGLHPTDLSQTFSTGGYYYWSFRKVDGEWKISYLFLDITWQASSGL